MSYRLIFCCCFDKRKVRIKVRKIKVKVKVKVNPTERPIVYGYSKKYNDW